MMVGSKRRYLIGAVVSLICYIESMQSYNFLSNESIICGSETKTNSKNYSYSYPEFEEVLEFRKEGNASATFNVPENVNKLKHSAKFGLGHRLTKITSAWHLTKALNLTRMQLHWGDCKGVGNIFPQLFGSDHIDVPGSDNLEKKVNRTVFTDNDVSGYYGGQNYKDFRIELPQSTYKDSHNNHNDSPFLEKLDSDLQLFRILRKRFVGKQDVMRFMEEHNFRDHLVIGLHLRLGNSEAVNFKNAGRGVENELDYVYNIIDLIESFIEKMQVSHPERFSRSNVVNDTTMERGRILSCPMKQTKSPLLFLATDSPKFISIIANDTNVFGMKMIVMPQVRVDEGVTFDKFKVGDKCVRGWRDMLLDNIVLSFSDVLIAARYSTFTQTLPMSLVFGRSGNSSSSVRNSKGPRFCEASDTGKTMTCAEDARTWLFRDDAQKLFNYSIIGNDTDGAEAEGATVHRVEVHLPDVVASDHYLKATQFLTSSSSNNNAPENMMYGSTFDPKYRSKSSCNGCRDFSFK